MLQRAVGRCPSGLIRCALATLFWAGLGSSAFGSPYLDVVISEVMYHAPGTDVEGEFVELTNRGSLVADLAGWQLADGVDYAFPAGTTLVPGEALIVAANPTTATALYDDPASPGTVRILGPYVGRLDNDGERIELVDTTGGMVCQVWYNDNAPWPDGGDGDGRSLELTDLTRNGNVGRFWQASPRLLGTPGAPNDPPTATASVVLNEFLANSSSSDWIELYNTGTTPIDVAGYHLTDDPASPTKSTIAASWSAGTTVIAPGGHWLAYRSDFDFGLSTDGEQLYLIAPDGVTWVDGLDFGDQPILNGSQGRYPDGDTSWKKMWTTTTTPGSANLDPTQTAIVIHELMYHPTDDTETDPGSEYVELHNRSASAMALGDWSLNRGVDYAFPAGTTIPAGGYLVIAANPSWVETTYAISGVLGPYVGVLSNFSDEIELEDALGNRADFVEYRQEGLWPTAPDGTGPSLELVNYDLDRRLPGAWSASLTGTGTPLAANSQYVANPPASIDRVRHWPLVPTSSDPVTVTARIGAGYMVSATIHYKRDQDPTFADSVAMYDDGAHGDQYPNDGIYGGMIPADWYGTTKQFYIEAVALGGTRRFPPDAPARSCMYQVDDQVIDSNLTFLRFVLTTAASSALMNDPYNDTPYDCTVILGDKAYYNSGVRFRGNVRDRDKKSYKVYMPAGYHFRGADRFDLNYEKNDRTCLKRKLIYDMINDMGLPPG